MPDAQMSAETRSWRRRVFAATWASYACYYFCRKPFYIAKSTLESEFGWDTEALGLVGASYLIAYTIGQFLSGFAGNRLGARRLVLGGMLVSLLCNIGFGLANDYAAFITFMVVNGLAQSTGWCGNVASMAEWFRRSERGTVMGFWATNFQVGGVLANLSAAYVLGQFGFRYSFFFGSLVMAACWLFFAFNQRNKPQDVGLPPVDQAAADEDSADGAGWSRDVWTNVLLIGAFYFFVKFIRYSLWSWAPYLLDRYYGLTASDAGYLSTVFDVCGIAGVIAAGWLSDRYFSGRRVKISFLFIIAMAGSCTVLFLFGTKSLMLFGISMGLIGFALYGPDALMSGAGAIEVGSVRSAALAAGVINGMGSLGSVVQEFLLGRLLKDGGVGTTFATLVASSLFAAALLGVLMLRNRSGKADL